MSQATLNTTTASTTVPDSTRTLDGRDRCDRCRAQAYVAFEAFGTELLFCRHHSLAHEPKLVEVGARMLADNRSALEGENRLQGKSY